MGFMDHAHPLLLTKPYGIYNMKTHLTFNPHTIPQELKYVHIKQELQGNIVPAFGRFEN